MSPVEHCRIWKGSKCLAGAGRVLKGDLMSESCEKSSCEGCSSAGNCSLQTQSLLEAPNPYSHIRTVIGVNSGKGGVGKSFVTASLASAMTAEGYRVGILDADITGPSIPKMYGLHGPAVGDERGVLPIPAQDGTKIMSVNLLMQDEEAPVIWRGPILAGTVKQFWNEVCWGDLDYLFVDMPPGTGDVPLTIFQSLPVDGVVTVTSPQDLVTLIVKKAYHMMEQMDIPVIGVIENYSYMTCPCCGERISVFGESGIEQVTEELGIDLLGKLPVDPEWAKAADSGTFASLQVPGLQKAVEKIKALNR